jgi:sugar lactone lactonase YvrE
VKLCARTLVAVLAMAALGLLAGAGLAGSGARTIVTFDAGAAERPEGVAVDRRGNVFMSLAPLGRLLKLAPGARRPAVFATVPGIDAAGGDLGMLGLAVDRRGNLYAGVAARAAQGIWRFDRRTGAARRLPGTEAIPFPNGLAFDRRGNLYVASSSEGPAPGGGFLGGIWRVSRRGDVARIMVDPVLGGTGQLIPGGVGANGIAVRRGQLLVVNTEQGALLRIRVRPDGSLGVPKVLASGAALGGSDGLALDVRGRIYVAVIGRSAIVRVGPGGRIRPVADAGDGLDWASSLAFDTRPGHRRTLYAVNFAIGEMFGNPPGHGPALLTIPVDAPGMLLP